MICYINRAQFCKALILIFSFGPFNIVILIIHLSYGQVRLSVYCKRFGNKWQCFHKITLGFKANSIYLPRFFAVNKIAYRREIQEEKI